MRELGGEGQKGETNEKFLNVLSSIFCKYKKVRQRHVINNENQQKWCWCCRNVAELLMEERECVVREAQYRQGKRESEEGREILKCTSFWL